MFIYLLGQDDMKPITTNFILKFEVILSKSDKDINREGKNQLSPFF